MGPSWPFSGSFKCTLRSVIIFICNLILFQHADNAQQSFSSSTATTIHLAIPALEALHKAWSSRAKRPKYQVFAEALQAGCLKIDEYYERTTNSPAYIIAMGMSLFISWSTSSNACQYWIRDRSWDISRSIGRWTCKQMSYNASKMGKSFFSSFTMFTVLLTTFISLKNIIL